MLQETAMIYLSRFWSNTGTDPLFVMIFASAAERDMYRYITLTNPQIHPPEPNIFTRAPFTKMV